MRKESMTAHAKIITCNIHNAEGRETPPTPLMEQLIDSYRDSLNVRKAEFSALTLRMYNNQIERHIRPRWSPVRADEVSSALVDAWLAGMPLAAASVMKTKRILKLIFDHAVRIGLVIKNPLLGPVTVPAKGIPRRSLAKEDAMLAFIRGCPHARVVLLLVLVLGLRPSELMGLLWQHIDIEEGRLAIRQTRVGKFTQASASYTLRRSIWLRPELVAILLGFRKSSKYSLNHHHVLASPHASGDAPYWPSSVMSLWIQPAFCDVDSALHVSWRVLQTAHSQYVTEVARSVLHTSFSPNTLRQHKKFQQLAIQREILAQLGICDTSPQEKCTTKLHK